MIRHISKIIWKNRKKSFLLILGFLLSYLSVIAILTIISNFLDNKGKTLGFEYENVYKFEMATTANFDDNQEEAERQIDGILQTIRDYQGVEKLGYWHYNFPFSQQEVHPGDDIFYGDKSLNNDVVDMYSADENMQEILDINLVEGRWFDRSDIVASKRRSLINQNMKEALFGDENPIGKTISFCGRETEIIGIIDDFRYRGEFSNSLNLLILHESFRDSVHYDRGTCMWCNGCGWDVFLFKSRSNDPDFEANLIGLLKTKFPDWVIDITTLDDLHHAYMKRTWTPIIIIAIVVLFVLSNVLFGLFGLLWYSISLRKAEIGLRMAVGAHKSLIYKQFIFEMLALVTLGIIPGIIIAIQFPLLQVFDIPLRIYLQAIGISSLLMYVLVALCALAPSAQAAAINPATALHDE